MVVRVISIRRMLVLMLMLLLFLLMMVSLCYRDYRICRNRIRGMRRERGIIRSCLWMRMQICTLRRGSRRWTFVPIC
jgi:hypothetical protein